MNRRRFLSATIVGFGSAAAGRNSLLEASLMPATISKDNVHQSVCRWCFNSLSIEQLAEAAVKIGLKGIDLVNPGDFPVLKKHNLVGTMVLTHGIAKGLNRKENHQMCLDTIRKAIEAAADAGYPNVICFSGNREGLGDEEGLEVCAEGLKQIVGLAEQKKVTISMELLNSKLNHKDYMCDRTEWGAKLVDKVGSERFKLLYDIYHMQVQEGDVIATIRKYKDYIAHYHTAGVPGRNELDDTQELNYVAISKAILDTGFKGYFAHEFIPKREPVASLDQAARICDV